MTDEQIIELMARAMWGECDRFGYETDEPVSYGSKDDDFDIDRELVRDEATAALTALRSAGMAVVPREPTGEQVDVMASNIRGAGFSGDGYLLARVVYRVMINTAEGKTE